MIDDLDSVLASAAADAAATRFAKRYALMRRALLALHIVFWLDIAAAVVATFVYHFRSA